MNTIKQFPIEFKIIQLLLFLFCYNQAYSQEKPRLAVFSGPTATIQNSHPLITSNKARANNNLPLLTNPEGKTMSYDRLYYQKIAAPVTL